MIDLHLPFDLVVNDIGLKSMYIPQVEKEYNVWNHTLERLKNIKSRSEPYPIVFQGIEIIIHPNVWSPSTESLLLTEHIHTSNNERILDITTGCGIAAVVAGIGGATGLAVDINPHAVRNANENFKKYNLNMKAIESDLFQNVSSEKFDQIFCNPPYYEGDPKEPLDYAFFGGRDFVEKLFNGLRDYLKPGGRALITYAEWADFEFFEEMAGKKDYSLSVIDKKQSEDGRRVYRLYETT